MILLKHNVAAKRRELQNSEASALIRDKNIQKEAVSRRAATWRSATKRLDEERQNISWEMQEEQEQTQVLNRQLEREVQNVQKVASNRAKKVHAEDRLKLVRHRRVLEKRELEHELAAKRMVSELKSAERQEQLWLKQVRKEDLNEAAHAEVLQRRAYHEAQRQRHFESLVDDSEDRRLAGAEVVQLSRMESQNELINANRERFLRQKANLTDRQIVEEEARYADEVTMVATSQAVEERRQQQLLDIQSTLARRREVRECAIEGCQARKDVIHAVEHKAKVEDILTRMQLRHESVVRHRLEMEEIWADKAMHKDDALNSARLRVQEEREDGRLQAIAEMEEARSVMEDYGISVNMVGLQVEPSNHQLAMEDSLQAHESRALRLSDSESLRVTDVKCLDNDDD